MKRFHATRTLVVIMILGWVVGLGVSEGLALKARTKDLQFDDKDLKIRLWTDETRSFFKVGDAINLLFQANQDCYVTVFAVGTSGRITVVFPNKWHQSNRVQGGKVYSVVPQNSETALRVRGPEGIEVVRAIATTSPSSIAPQSAADFEAIMREQGRQESPDGLRVLAQAEMRIQIVDEHGTGLQVPTRAASPAPAGQKIVRMEPARDRPQADKPSQPGSRARFPFRAELVNEQSLESSDRTEKPQIPTSTRMSPVLPFSRVDAPSDQDRPETGLPSSPPEKPAASAFPFRRIAVDASEIFDEDADQPESEPTPAQIPHPWDKFRVAPPITESSGKPAFRPNNDHSASTRPTRAENLGESGRHKTIEGIAVSVKALQSGLKGCSQNKKCADSLQRLGGMKDLLGYVVDNDNEDIILVGRADGRGPGLHAENLVAALRNAWEFAEPPGCSIDPQPDTLQELSRVNGDGQEKLDFNQLDRSNRDWRRVCDQAQNVRVMGVPFDTKFAKIMVDADYYMKRLVDGSVSLDIDGFESVSDMVMRIAKEEIKKGKERSIPPTRMNRFWFAPGETTFVEDEDAVWLTQSKVALLTEEEFLSKGGEVIHSGRPDPFAQRFAQAFTDKYSDIAKRKPIYKELEGLYRVVALAGLLNSRGAIEESRLDISFLLHEYPLGSVNVPRTVSGLSHVKEFRHTRGNLIHRFCLRNCGGVTMNVSPVPAEIQIAPGEPKPAVQHEVIKARPSKDAFSWKVKLRVPSSLSL